MRRPRQPASPAHAVGDAILTGNDDITPHFLSARPRHAHRGHERLPPRSRCTAFRGVRGPAARHRGAGLPGPRLPKVCPIVLTAVSMVDKTPDEQAVLAEVRTRVADVTGMAPDDVDLVAVSSLRKWNGESSRDPDLIGDVPRSVLVRHVPLSGATCAHHVHKIDNPPLREGEQIPQPSGVS